VDKGFLGFLIGSAASNIWLPHLPQSLALSAQAALAQVALLQLFES
jgi:hypothetical protein